MSMSINMHVYQLENLHKSIDAFVVEGGGYREGAMRPQEFVHTFANHFGYSTETQFFVVYNEFYEGYNPGIEFLNTVDRYYFPERDHDSYDHDTFRCDTYQTFSEGANASDILNDVLGDEREW